MNDFVLVLSPASFISWCGSVASYFSSKKYPAMGTISRGICRTLVFISSNIFEFRLYVRHFLVELDRLYWSFYVGNLSMYGPARITMSRHDDGTTRAPQQQTTTENTGT